MVACVNMEYRVDSARTDKRKGLCETCTTSKLLEQCIHTLRPLLQETEHLWVCNDVNSLTSNQHSHDKNDSRYTYSPYDCMLVTWYSVCCYDIW